MELITQLLKKCYYGLRGPWTGLGRLVVRVKIGILTIILIDSLSLIDIWSFSSARNVWVKPWIVFYFINSIDIRNVYILLIFVNLLCHQRNRQRKFLLFVARPVHWMHSGEVDCCLDMTVSLAPSSGDSLIAAPQNLVDMFLWALSK